MQCVKGCPDGLLFAETIKKIFGIGAEIAVRIRCLAFGEFGDEDVALIAQAFVASAGIGECHGGEVMAAVEVAAQFALGCFPSAVGHTWMGETGSLAEAPQQTVVVERVQIGAIDLLLIAKETGQQTDIRQREGLGQPRNLLANSVSRFSRDIDDRVLCDRNVGSEQRGCGSGRSGKKVTARKECHACWKMRQGNVLCRAKS